MKNEYRPRVHFTPSENWMNDPNGMVYVNGSYHLFYQYYPLDTVWGPMHWGHAVSEDLLHWTHKPIALYPDELGYIFSGSCVFDKDNVSGFGTKDNPPLIAIFTSHNPENNQEQQSIAYSLDYEHFEKYDENPVISNTEKKDFRDPKIFWNPVKECWSLALAAGHTIEFYQSKNLKEWSKTGEFITGEHGFGGICECPDCFPLETGEGTKWVLIISMILPKEKIGQNAMQGEYWMEHVTQYYVGEFDGNTFINTMQSKEPLLLDFGPDNYAGVTFQNLNEKIMIGWAENWAYANKTPSKEFRGKMTLARRMSLINTGDGYRLRFQPIGLEKYQIETNEIKKQYKLQEQCFGLHIDYESHGKITLCNKKGEELYVQVTDTEIILDRSNAGVNDFEEHFGQPAFGRFVAKRTTSGPSHMEIIFDHALIEVFGEDGLIPISASVYPTEPYEQILLEGNARAWIYVVDK